MSYITSLVTTALAVGSYYVFKHVYTGSFSPNGWEAVCFVLIWQGAWLRIAVRDFESKFLVGLTYAKVLSNKHLGKLTSKDFEEAARDNEGI